MEEKQRKIGGNIAALRRAKGLPQEQLASLLGVSAPAVSKWERGMSMPDISLLMPLAEILDSMLLESDMEGMIKAKGFSDVFVNYSSSYINVMVKSAELTETEVAQIVEIIQGKTGRDIDYIKIIPVQ